MGLRKDGVVALRIKDKDGYWHSWFLLTFWAIVICALIAGCMVAGLQWQKANYKEYCEARGWHMREAGGKMWCE